MTPEKVNADYLEALKAVRDSSALGNLKNLLTLRREQVKEQAMSGNLPAEKMLRLAGAAEVIQDLVNDLSRES